jgi:transposase
VISLETWQTIRHLASIGKSQRFIAQTLGISRDAVARALKQEELPHYQREPTVQHTLEAFRPVVEQGLARGLSGKRLLAAVRQSGYSASTATFYRWLQDVQKERATPQATCRFETGPGEQAQFDWSPYLVQIGGECVRIVIYSLVLGYSRRIHFYPSVCERQDSVIEGLEVALRHFEGSCRFVVIDNAKTMVLAHRHQTLVWNPCFLAFCGHYRIQPIAATPVHPQTKGKIENPYFHLETGLLTGGAWRDWAHLGEEIKVYEQAREERVHQTTRQTPAQRFEEERATLLPLPTRTFVGCLQHRRQLNNDGLFSFRGNRYCVPATKGVREVRVRTKQGRELLVFDASANLLICHTLRPPDSPPAILPECYQHLKARRRLSLATSMALLRQRFNGSSVVESFLTCLLARHTHHPEDPLSGVVQLLEGVPDDVALLAMSEAVSLQRADPATVGALLAPKMAGTPAQSPDPTPLSGLVPALDVERPLSVYGACLPPLQEYAPNPQANANPKEPSQ